MAGNGQSGRPRLPGRVYRLTVRYRPDRHTAELGDLLEQLAQAGPGDRAAILDRVAAGGLGASDTTAEEASETALLLDGLFS